MFSREVHACCLGRSDKAVCIVSWCFYSLGEVRVRLVEVNGCGGFCDYESVRPVAAL